MKELKPLRLFLFEYKLEETVSFVKKWLIFDSYFAYYQAEDLSFKKAYSFSKKIIYVEQIESDTFFLILEE